ncbi:hypothetical protein F5144DRAFT_547662 [Chaetomium tenue]|uniref:Uncharacterized protein n=1 Tax=Chaetomium tenue TaxID=1854479 RepID=A0ACB7P808_9PEZI|nr:hypothetical protein F5144DRAFT_547662 [Chaetomium globosum]
MARTHHKPSIPIRRTAGQRFFSDRPKVIGQLLGTTVTADASRSAPAIGIDQAGRILVSAAACRFLETQDLPIRVSPRVSRSHLTHDLDAASARDDVPVFCCLPLLISQPALHGQGFFSTLTSALIDEKSEDQIKATVEQAEVTSREREQNLGQKKAQCQALLPYTGNPKMPGHPRPVMVEISGIETLYAIARTEPLACGRDWAFSSEGDISSASWSPAGAPRLGSSIGRLVAGSQEHQRGATKLAGPRGF